MATDMGRGIMAPDSSDNISASGVDEMRTIAATTALAVDDVEHRGFIPDGSDLNNFKGAAYRGAWFLKDPASAATILGLPGSNMDRGTLLVYSGPSGYSYSTQIFMKAGLRPATYTRTMTNASEWSEWQTNLTTGRVIPEGTNLDDWYGHEWAGGWYVSSFAHAGTIVGLPTSLPGNLLILSGQPGNSYTAQVYFTAGSSSVEQNVYWRSLAGVGAWNPWKVLGGGNSDPFEPIGAGIKNADLMDVLVQRKGGPIGTGGIAAFALRLDHGTVAFQDHLAALLKKYGLPATMAVYSEQREIKPLTNSVAWDVVESWHRLYGMTFGNHSDDHLDKPDAAGWYGGTIESAAELKTHMPTVPVEQYIPHGSIGYDRYGGFNQANSHEAIVGTLAGRMALSSHALISGYRGGQFRPLHGRPMQGLAHWSMEEATPAEFQAMLDEAIKDRVGLAVMFHPEFIGRAGKMTWTQVEECLAYVAQKRDEGVLVPLTLDGLACADSSSSYRHDLHLDSDLSDPAQWTATGFTLTPGSFEGSAGDSVYHDVPMTRRAWARGGAREAQWDITAAGAATLTMTVGSSNGAWATTRTVLVSGGATTVHMPFGIPLNQSQPLRTTLTLDSGSVTVTGSRLYAT